MIAGRGMELAVGGRPPHRIDRPFEPFVFSGDEPTACRLLDGPIRDFNLMVARTSARSHLEVRHLEGASRLHAPLSGDVIIHCFHGAIDLATSTGTAVGMLLSNCTAIVNSAAGGMPHDLRMIAAGGGAMIAIIEIAVNRGSVGDR
ncbi:MAG TPA: HutD family protein, partial [Sphingomicrobium sp.]